MASDLIARVKGFFGKPVLKNALTFGGAASVLTLLAAVGSFNVNPPGVLVLLWLVCCVAWVIATRAIWR